MRSFVRAVAKTTVGTFIALILRVVATKIIAVTVGPEGVGLLSLFRQTVNVFTQIGTFGSQTGIVHGLASRDKQLHTQFLASVVVLLLIGSIIGVILFLYLTPFLFSYLRHTNNDWITIAPWLIVPLLLNVLLVFFQGILNGRKQIGKLAITRVVQALALAVVAWPVSELAASGYPVALIFFLAMGALGGVLYSGYNVYQSGALQGLAQGLFKKDKLKDIVPLLKFSGTVFFSLFYIAVVVLAMRMMVADFKGLEYAGYFDASWVICTTYLMFFTTSVVTYYFPAMTELNSEDERYKLLSFAATIITITCVPLVVFLIEFKPLVIRLLYSEKFLPAIELLRWMLIGGFFNISSSVLGNLLLAKKELKVYFWKQLIVYSFMLVIAYYAVYKMQFLEGLAIAYFIMCVVNFLFLIGFCSFRYKKNYLASFGVSWFIGLMLIAGASFASWNNQEVDWIFVMFSFVVILIFCTFIPSREERSKLISRLRKRIS